MKKFGKIILCILLGLFVAFAAIACDTASDSSNTGGGSSSFDETEKPDAPDEKPDEKPGDTDDSNTSDTQPTAHSVLVVYFSASGNTEKVAGYIAAATKGDLFELVPVDEYTLADLSWTTPGSRVNREHDDESLRDIALVKTAADNWADYDTVFIGYPIWWQIAAWPVNNFVKLNDFTDKTVIPFATSASSGLGESGALLAQMTGTGDWQTGRRFSSSASESSVKEWVNGLGLAA